MLFHQITTISIFKNFVFILPKYIFVSKLSTFWLEYMEYLIPCLYWLIMSLFGMCFYCVLSTMRFTFQYMLHIYNSTCGFIRKLHEQCAFQTLFVLTLAIINSIQWNKKTLSHQKIEKECIHAWNLSYFMVLCHYYQSNQI